MCFQLDRIKSISSLPCLEKLNLSSNPMCIIPDYRTKVLAQFGDRAAEVLPLTLCTLILLSVHTHTHTQVYTVQMSQASQLLMVSTRPLVAAANGEAT